MICIRYKQIKTVHQCNEGFVLTLREAWQPRTYILEHNRLALAWLIYKMNRKNHSNEYKYQCFTFASYSLIWSLFYFLFFLHAYSSVVTVQCHFSRLYNHPTACCFVVEWWKNERRNKYGGMRKRQNKSKCAEICIACFFSSWWM